MGEISLRKALDDYKTVYMVYRNFAERTRVEYLNDLEDLVGYLEKSGTSKVGQLELARIERYLAEFKRCDIVGATRDRETVVTRFFFVFSQMLIMGQSRELNAKTRHLAGLGGIKQAFY